MTIVEPSSMEAAPEPSPPLGIAPSPAPEPPPPPGTPASPAPEPPPGTPASPAPERPPPLPRTAYARFVLCTTRWKDNDVYGHVNNAVYYAYIDSAVNRLLMDVGLLQPSTSTVIGLVVETRCRYLKPMVYPDDVHVGVRVTHIGRSSVRYGLGLFRNDDTVAAAEGELTHVYVARDTRRPVALPPQLRDFVNSLRREP